ncbi:CmcJ/NvfI family oxidoreductase [Kitasatospora sp. NPDC004745]|uniref:CmcJ/NvfI family oxidoreductase n=1 Tax=unclassified Kitasatospora TaxID=2633591 RepID=UPI0033CBF7C7
MTTPTITAGVRYLAPRWRDSGTAPEIGDWGSLATNTVRHDVPVANARGTEYGLDTTGFTLLEHRTEVDFRDESAVLGRYFAELAPLVKEQSGADEVFVTHHFVRWGDPEDFEAGYAGFLHGDKGLGDPFGYTRSRIEELGIELGSDQDHDFAWYNTWQPVDREVFQHPLALMDARTVPREHIHDYYYTSVGEPHPESSPVFDEGHRFYYFPRMRTDELLMFKQLDTRPDRAPTCLHSAFTDPTAPDDAPLRRSIEVRWMCAFKR